MLTIEVASMTSSTCIEADEGVLGGEASEEGPLVINQGLERT
jgi:hypothetical protein